jgi:hypothetical protein
MRPQFLDRWGSFSGRGGKAPPTPAPTSAQRATLMRMHAEGRTQVGIANAIGVPRSQIRCWYGRFGLVPLSRLAGHMTGRADTRARASL